MRAPSTPRTRAEAVAARHRAVRPHRAHRPVPRPRSRAAVRRPPARDRRRRPPSPSTCSTFPTRRGSAGIAIDATEADTMRAELRRMVDAHRRTLDHLTTGVAIFGADQPAHLLQRRVPLALGPRRRLPRPRDRAIPPCSTGCATRRRLPEQQDFRKWKAELHEAYRATEAGHARMAPAGRPHAARRHHAQSGRRRDLSLRRHHRAARAAAPLRGADPRAGRDARQPRGRRRGVRQRRPAAAVQSGVRADVEVRSGGACRSARTSRR